MARPKKKIEPVVEPTAELVVEVAVEAPKTRTITLKGAKGSVLPVGINGVMSSLPCGVELEVSNELYDIVEPYIA